MGFYEYSTPQPGGSAVYRYFDTVNGGHFYTASSTEVATIAITRPDLHAEGIAFYTPN